MLQKTGSTSFFRHHFGAARFVAAFFALPILLLVHFGADLFGENFMKIIFFFCFFQLFTKKFLLSFFQFFFFKNSQRFLFIF